MMMAGRFLRWFNKVTITGRIRGGYNTFYFGAPPLQDRFVTWFFYTATANRWDDRAERDRHLGPLRAGLERCREPKTVLDIGTGAGAAARESARRWPQAEVTGVDAVRRMVKFASKASTSNLHFLHCRMERLPFADDSFDLCTVMNAVPEMNELSRVLRPDGQVLTIGNYDELPDDNTPWVARWSEFGFTRVATGVVGGHWQLFERTR
jgi:ubiquinone/menaquinone biosynthesis C-methylase UbiE